MGRLEKISKGDYVLITGDNRITRELWDRTYPQGIFGKVIDVIVRFSPYDGRKLPTVYLVRCKAKGVKMHLRKIRKDLVRLK